MPQIVGDNVPTVHIRVVQGDTFVLAIRRLDSDGEIIDTTGYEARAMIRKKDGRRAVVGEALTGGGTGKGAITVGIQGEDEATQTNLTVTFPASVTEDFPRVGDERKAEWEWDLEVVSDPEDADNTTNKWMGGDVYAVNEVTHD